MNQNKKKSVIRGVLEEELLRNEKIKNRYIIEIEQLPKGSISLRRIGRQEYYYLKYRENKKVVSKYLGKKNELIISDIEEKINKRKYLEEVIKDLKIEEKELLKALR